MTITRSTVATNSGSNSTTNSFSYTVPSGATLVVLRISTRSTVGGGQTMSSVTLGGVACTNVTSAYYAVGLIRGWIYYIANPTAGANTITATWSSTVNSIIGATSFTGGVAEIKYGTSGTGSTSVSLTLSPALLAGEIALDIMGANDTRTWTASANQTKEWGETKSGVTPTWLYTNGSYSSTAGNATMSWTPATSVIAIVASCVVVREVTNSNFFEVL